MNSDAMMRHLPSLSRFADELRELSPDRAAPRIRALADAVQLGQDPYHNLMAIAAIAIAAADDIRAEGLPPAPETRQ
jgi:hypothetical protein